MLLLLTKPITECSGVKRMLKTEVAPMRVEGYCSDFDQSWPPPELLAQLMPMVVDRHFTERFQPMVEIASMSATPHHDGSFTLPFVVEEEDDQILLRAPQPMEGLGANEPPELLIQARVFDMEDPSMITITNPVA